jgi:hypothetical protein
VIYAQTAVNLESDPRYVPFEPGFASFIQSLAHIYAGQLQNALEITRGFVDIQEPAPAYGLSSFAACLEASGHTAQAQEFAEEGLARARRSGSPFWTAFALWVKGSVSSEADPAGALAAWHEGLALARENRMPYWEGFISRDAAALQGIDADPRDALELFGAAIELFHRGSNVAQLTITLASLSRFFERTGHIEQAATLCAGLLRQTHSVGLAPDLLDLEKRLQVSLGEAAFTQVSERATAELGDTAHTAQRQIHLALTQLDP